MTRARQIALGLLVGGILVAGLQWYVSEADAERSLALAARRATGPDGDAAPDLAADGRQRLADLSGVAERFLLVTSPSQLPADCAPVLRIGPGGAILILVPPRPTTRPETAAWPDVGIVLSTRRVCDLGASERSSLLAIWSRLAGPARLTADRIHAPGCEFLPGELDLLLRWLR